MTLLYRILSFIIYAGAALTASSMLFSFGLFLSSAQGFTLLFLFLACILYAFYHFRFQKIVLQQQQIATRRLREMLVANGVVALILSSLLIIVAIVFLQNPDPFLVAQKDFGFETPRETQISLLKGVLVYSIIQVLHVLWTFALVKKYKALFL